MCLEDTLGQHLWGGFKEGVGAAYQKCRHCFCDFDTLHITQIKGLSNHTKEFKRLFPDDENILPKHNYMLHFVNLIKELGPPMRYYSP